MHTNCILQVVQWCISCSHLISLLIYFVNECVPCKVGKGAGMISPVPKPWSRLCKSLPFVLGILKTFSPIAQTFQKNKVCMWLHFSSQACNCLDFDSHNKLHLVTTSLIWYIDATMMCSWFTATWTHLSFLYWQKEFKLCRELILRVQSVWKIHSPYATVCMNLKKIIDIFTDCCSTSWYIV